MDDISPYQLATLAAQIHPELCKDKSGHRQAIDLARNLISVAEQIQAALPEDEDYQAFLRTHSFEEGKYVPYRDGVLLLTGQEAGRQVTRAKGRFEQVMKSLKSVNHNPDDYGRAIALGRLPREQKRVWEINYTSNGFLPREIYNLKRWFDAAKNQGCEKLEKIFKNLLHAP